MKRLFLLLLVCAVVGCAPKNKKEVSLIDLVPQNTSIVLQVNDSLSLNNSPLLSQIFKLDKSLQNTIKSIRPSNGSGPQVFFVTPIGKNDNVVGLILKKNANDSVVRYDSSREYSGQHIGIIDKGGKTFYSTQMGDFEMLSQSQLVIENGIRNFQNQQRGISSTAFYELAESMNDNLSANFLVQSQTDRLLRRFFPDTPLFPDTGRDWLEMGLEVAENGFNLNGVVFLNDSIPDGLNLVRNQKPQVGTLSKVVPSNFVAFLNLPVDDLSELEVNFKRLVRRINLPVQQIDFSNLNFNEIAWIKTEKDQSVVFRIDEMEDLFPSFVSAAGDSKKYRNFSYSKITLPSDLSALLGIFGDPLQPQWGAWHENLLLLSESEAGLKNILGNYQDGNTLERNPGYLNLKAQLSDEHSFLWVGNTKNLSKHWSKNNGPEKIKDLPLEGYPYVAFQGVGEASFTHLHLLVEKNQGKTTKGKVNNAYTMELDSPALSAPQWFKNHRNKGMDAVIQDQNNVLYLFSNTGKLFWKKQLPGPIIGKIHQVDLYKNRRFQLAFRTADRLMVLDRNGKIVNPFDIKVPKSTHPLPLSVFDYDNNQNYRFLVAQDQSLFMYDNRGKKVNGFSLKKVNSKIRSAPKHIRLQSKDYILIPLENNTLKVVSRQGSDRVAVKGSIDFSGNPIFSYLNTFATTDKAGNLIQVDRQGNKVTSPLKLAPNHRIDATTKTLVTLSENIFNIKGIPVKLPYGNYTPPKIFYRNNTLYFSTTDTSAQKVYLFYSNGNPVSGFPVYGNSAAELDNSDKDKALELVVASEDNSLIIYEINE